MSSKRAPSLKDARKCAIFNRSESNETNSVKSPTFSTMVLLAMNLKKSPWLLSRCKKTLNHVQFAQTLLKDSDNLKVIVKLMRTPRVSLNDERYLVLISSFSDEKEEMDLLLGMNVVNEKVTVGLILPITMETDICLDGDGGFFVSNPERKYSFQPVSIQEMWSALQALVKCVLSARSRKRQQVLPEHYRRLPRSEAQQVCEWERVNDALSSKTNEMVPCESKESFQLKTLIRRKLQEILVNIDLDTVTSREIRDKLEEKLKMNVQESLGLSLSQYKQFIDEETILVMRQMDSPSQILDFLYLGSEWNASNFEELKRNRIGYILNVTKEIENFFPGMFKYCNVQVYDYEETELLRHWDNTFKFISEAMSKNSNILVHCKMGISRSASTVIAFVMKYKQWDVEEAYQFVKQKRSCIQPNPGFMQQLITYQGILDASNHRHSKLFRSRSISSLDKNNKKQSKDHKVRPKSNAEQRKIEVGDTDVTSEATRDLEKSDMSDKFVIVDADDACLSAASETCDSLESQTDVSSVIDDSTLSTSSVLRQWSSHSSGGPLSMEKEGEKEINVVNEDIFEEENDEISIQKLFQNSKRRFCSCPDELNANVLEDTDVRLSPKLRDEVAPLKPCVRFSSTRQKWSEKRPIKRHHSMYQQ